jgi:hypothetical protein
MNARIVLDPSLSYVELNASVSRLGWEHVAGPAYPPLVPDEPEFASWRRDTDSLTYACNPVAWLRVLDLSAVAEAAQRLALIGSLPLLGYDQLPRLLRAGDRSGSCSACWRWTCYARRSIFRPCGRSCITASPPSRGRPSASSPAFDHEPGASSAYRVRLLTSPALS